MSVPRAGHAGETRRRARRAAGGLLFFCLALGLRAPAAPAADAGAVRLQLSGILGQSEPAGREPLPFIGVAGAAMDRAGTLWTAGGGQLLGFARQAGGEWVCARRVTLPVSLSHLGTCWDGERLFLAGSDGKLSCFSPEAADGAGPAPPVVPVAGISLGEKVRAFAVAPAGLNRGFAARARFFVLSGNTVSGFRANGDSAGTLLSLAPAGAGWWYCALAVEPATGDLLVGSYYPDNKVYRFAADGRQVTTDGWPRTAQAASLIGLGGQAWVLQQGGGALPLPRAQARADASAIGAPWTMYPSGLAQGAEGSYWLASSQGLVQFDRQGQPTGRRLGGLTGVRALAAAPDGTLVAAVEGGQRMLRLAIDDEAGSPLTCNANEPWRAGAGWTSKGCALAWDGTLFLAPDETGRQLWGFDPWHTGWRETPWVKLAEPGALAGPRAVAAGEGLFWVLDGKRLLEGRRGETLSFREARLPGLDDLSPAVALAAREDGLLVVAWPDRVRAFARDGAGEYRLLWTSPERFQEVAGVAVAGECAVVADRGARAVSALSLQDGRVVAVLPAGAVPGGMQPTAVAALRRWVLVADEAGKRLLRLKLSRD